MSSREPEEFFKKAPDKPARVAIFLSGTGTNAEKVLELWQEKGGICSFTPVCLVTDRPHESRAREIAEKFNMELISEDIKAFYLKNGLSNTSLITEDGRRVRKLWTEALYSKIRKLDVDFGVFAGFIPLTNITDHFPCLNVHPGDLTVCDNEGQRIFTGLHTIPVRKAVSEDHETLKSSVIIACKYEGQGSGMDEGIILGVSEDVKIDWMGKSRSDWLSLYENRGERPDNGWDDEFQHFLGHNLNNLKVSGDWVVFPRSIDDFAQGKFAHLDGSLFYKSGSAWLPIEVIEYKESGKEIYMKSSFR